MGEVVVVHGSRGGVFVETTDRELLSVLEQELSERVPSLEVDKVLDISGEWVWGKFQANGKDEMGERDFVLWVIRWLCANSWEISGFAGVGSIANFPNYMLVKSV